MKCLLIIALLSSNAFAECKHKKGKEIEYLQCIAQEIANASGPDTECLQAVIEGFISG